MSATEIDVLHADASLLVINKPAGLLSVPGRGPDKQDCLSARVQNIYPDALVVHRLDMATSGLMVLARTSSAQRFLNDAFANRAVTKRYIAMVAGCLEPPLQDWGLMDWPIALDWPNRPRSVIDPVHGKPSVTRWRVLAHDSTFDCTRVELEPITGRSHQLRVHLLALGHPILGDALYGNASVQARSSRLLLHAQSIAISHPTSGQALYFNSPSPF